MAIGDLSPPPTKVESLAPVTGESFGLNALAVLAAYLLGTSGGVTRFHKTLAREVRPDVVHFHNISLLGPEVLAVRPAASTPVTLYTAHEHWLVCPTHFLWKYKKFLCGSRNCLPCTNMRCTPP